MIYDTSGSIFSEIEKDVFSLSIWLESWYPLICDFLKIKKEEDEHSAKTILKSYKSKILERSLLEQISEKKVLIIAPGMNLEEEFQSLLSEEDLRHFCIICSDGATSYLLNNNIIPQIIVTDLDGNVSDQIKAQRLGSKILVHIHGDNLNVVESYMKDISEGEFAITTQTRPSLGSYNFLGFTDGDRAVCLATFFNAQEIKLIGFDFGKSIGKYSKNIILDNNKIQLKMKKFMIAKSIINWCANQKRSKFI